MKHLGNPPVGWHENNNNYFFFIENFLVTLFYCYQELDKRFLTVNSEKVNKTARIEATVLNSIVPISKREICEILPDHKCDHRRICFRKMVKSGKVRKIGKSSNTKYFRNVVCKNNGGN